MSVMRKVATAVVGLVGLIGGVSAGESADLRLRGTLKDEPVSIVMGEPAGLCYIRADAGYSVAGTPDVRWPVFGAGGAWQGDKVSKVEAEDALVLEGGFGCGSVRGGGGWRGELMLGHRGGRRIDGEPLVGAPPDASVVEPLHTHLTSYTLMLNAYRDLGNFGRFIPYAGAGIGLAYHDVSSVALTNQSLPVSQMTGGSDFAFAWQLMTGAGYRLSDRAVLDLGYRYVDLGKASSGRVDSAGAITPRVVIGDITAHEIKVGLRYQLGAGSNPRRMAMR